MTPTERLQARLDEALAGHDLKLSGSIHTARGGERLLDTCRWSAMAVRTDGAAFGPVASWSTVTECLKHGFTIDIDPPRAEARVMVEAKL